MKKTAWFVCFTILIAGAFASDTRMEVRVYYSNADQLYRDMGELIGGLDICTVQPAKTGEYYLVINATREELEQIKARGFRTEITYDDIADKFWEMAGTHDRGILRNFGYFYTYWEVRDTLQYLAGLYPSISRYYSAGNSHQGLNLIAFKISDNPLADEGEPAVCFNGATHAREPMGTYLCVDFIKYLLSNYGADSTITWLVNNREIYFIPVMNPDGYRYNSDSGGSLANWRKNRRIVQSPNIGIDLNRNYGYKWGYDNFGSSSNPSSETYRGPSRFSEPETQAARDYFLPKKIRTQMDYHSYGPYNLCVWGYSGSAEPIPDSIMQWEILDSMRAKNGFPAYSTGPIYRVLYAANGGSCEWEVKDTLHNGVQKFMTYAFSIETDQNDFWDGVSNMTTITNNINQCRPVNYYFTRIAGVFFGNLAKTVADTVLGNATGQLDPNETTHIWFGVKNRAVHPLDSAYNINAQLVSLDSQVTVQSASAVFPNIKRNSTGNNSGSRFIVFCSPNAVPGTIKRLRLVMTFKDDTCTITQALVCSLVVGSSPVAVQEQRPVNTERFMLAIVNNPVSGCVRFNASPAPSQQAVLEIYDAAGMLVTSVTGRRLVWNGTSRGGLPVQSGVYFYRYRDYAGQSKGKFVFVR